MELRQYTLQPGQRDVLIELFDREFVEPQEAVGMEVIGQFRDLDRPDRFVWFRGFADMGVRRAALEAFYDGPVWKAHRRAANATMLDSDDVLLLRPLTPTSGFAELLPRSPEQGASESPPVLIATICSLDSPADVPAIEGTLFPALVASGDPPLAVFVEEPSENTFPALPVRTGEHVLVWIQRLGESPDPRMHASRERARELLPGLVGTPHQLRLQPTPRSRLR